MAGLTNKSRTYVHASPETKYNKNDAGMDITM